MALLRGRFAANIVLRQCHEPEWYLISQDLPPSALEGGAQTQFGRAWSGEMSYHSADQVNSSFQFYYRRNSHAYVYFPPYLCKIFPCPHYGGGRSVARSFATLRLECATCGMMAHFAGLAALGTRGRGPNAVWEGLVRRNELSFRRPG